jgi:3-hydroxyisobutyrate dehydrogenase-like beta-hydroxyacid dehydrogenase
VIVGLVSPGAMGAAVGRVLVERGHRVVVALDDRGRASVERAHAAGLANAGPLAALVEEADLLLSIVPPAAALDVAHAVVATGGCPRYVDANAVAPTTAARIAEVVGDAFVDGDLIGGPPRPGGPTRLYLSGDGAADLAPELCGDGLEAVVLGAGPYAASAMKMAYAAWTKGTSALLLAIRAYAEQHGVDDALLTEWARSQPDVPDRSELARAVVPRAWRFSGELHEIADAFAAAGLPDGFGRAAAEVYEALAPFKDVDPAPDLAEVIQALTSPHRSGA